MMKTRRNRPTLLATLAALLGASALLLVASPRLAGATISWSAVSPSLPPNAVTGGGLTISTTSCPTDGWCIAVGNYPAVVGTTYYTAGLIVAESGSTWTASAAPLPANASTTDPQAFVQSVACASVGSCIAVGRYLDSSGATQGLIEQLANGYWIPSEAPLPPDANATGSTAYAQLTSVACPSVGWCTTLGIYNSTVNGEQAIIDTDSTGTWAALAAPLPMAASGSQFLSLSCPAVGSCVATGTYLVTGNYLGLIDTLSGGAWSATSLPLPAGASAFASIANNDLAVSCPSVGTCVVAGTTFDGNYEGFLDTLSGGTWIATAAPTPGNEPSTDVQLTSVSCSDSSTCVATGFVSISGVEQGLLEALAAGAWNASNAPVPAGTPVTTSVDLHSVACPTDGTCVAEGQSDANGVVNALFWDLSGGTWSVTPAPLPADASSSSDPLFAPIVCPAIGACVTVGTYLGSSGREGVIESDPSLAATTTTASLQQLSGQTASYSATVTGSGAQPTGSVVFSAGLNYICTAAISNGSATCTGPLPVVGSILASYSGDTGSAPSWSTAVNNSSPTAITATSGWWQITRINTWFPYVLQVQVTNSAGAGVPGALVTFTVPSAGPSGVFWGGNRAFTNSSGIATSPVLSANAKVGSFTVVATTAGVGTAAYFYLSNVRK